MFKTCRSDYGGGIHPTLNLFISARIFTRNSFGFWITRKYWTLWCYYFLRNLKKKISGKLGQYKNKNLFAQIFVLRNLGQIFTVVYLLKKESYDSKIFYSNTFYKVLKDPKRILNNAHFLQFRHEFSTGANRSLP